MGWAALSATCDRVALNTLGSVPVSAELSSGRGFLSQNSELVLEGQVVMVDYVLSVPTATFGWLGYGDQVTVDGRVFKVIHKALRVGEGMWVNVPLQPFDRTNLPVPAAGGEVIVDGNSDGNDILEGNT